METNSTTDTSTGKKILTLSRVFRLGSITLPDPDPSLLPEDAVALYQPNYPVLVSATLGDPFVEGDTFVYPVNKDVKTKG